MSNIAGEIPVVGQAFIAFKQLKKAKEARHRAAQLNKPMTTPSSILQNNAMARNSAGAYGVPGQDFIQDELDSSMAGVLDNLSQTQQSPAAIAAAALGALKNKNQAQGRLGVAAAEHQERMLSNLYGQNKDLAGYEMNNWNYNVRRPYEMALAEATQMESAGIQNAYGALQAHSNNDKDFFSKNGGGGMMGGGGGGAGGMGMIGGMVGGKAGGQAGSTGGGKAGGGEINTGFSQQQPWGGMGEQKSGFNTAQAPQMDSSSIMNYRIKTGDYLSSDFDIMAKMMRGSV